MLLDLPDHGAAPDEPHASQVELEASVAASVAALGDELVLVGHSYGAYLCARLAPRLSGRVVRMILVSGLAGLPAERAQGFTRMALQLRSGELPLPVLARQLALSWYGAEVTALEQQQVLQLIEQDSSDRRDRLLARLAQLAQPELRVGPYAAAAVVLHAERDAAVPVERGRELCALGSHARWEPLDSASHMLPLTHAAQVARAVFAP